MQTRFLFVDLDGTLLREDTFVESLLGCVRAGPRAWSAFFSLFTGIVAGKKRMAKYFDPSLVSVRPEIVELIESERARGSKVVLATGSPREVVDRLATALPAFDEIICSDGEVNRVSGQKLEAILRHCGGVPFAYAGNSLRSDRRVWSRAATVHVVGGRLHRWYFRSLPTERQGRFFERRLSWRALVAAVRPEQWSKNLLLFVPLVAAHVWSGGAWLQALLGFSAFSFTCSVVYLANDLLDKPFDRLHPRKSLRPIAAGALLTTQAVAWMGCLALAALALIAWIGSWAFAGIVAAYVIGAFAYSLFLKRVMLLDVFFLAGFYVVRLLAGSALTVVILSDWLLGVSLFAFASLAFLKRFTSLRREEFGVAQADPGRGYRPQDKEALGIFGIASAFAALVMLSLYMQSVSAVALYRTPVFLYALIPLCFFLFARVWLLAYRGEVKDDPVAFFLRDAPSYAVLVLAAACLALAS